MKFGHCLAHFHRVKHLVEQEILIAPKILVALKIFNNNAQITGGATSGELPLICRAKLMDTHVVHWPLFRVQVVWVKENFKKVSICLRLVSGIL